MANFKDKYPLPFALFGKKKVSAPGALCVGSVGILPISGTEPSCNYLSPFETLMSAQTEFIKVQFRS
jgi:hypothetical protein